jgi:hypothetical protein
MWWKAATDPRTWNGTRLISLAIIILNIYTDASRWGAGAFCAETGDFVRHEWTAEQQTMLHSKQTTVLMPSAEMAALAIGVLTIARRRQDPERTIRVHLHVDSEPVVFAVRARYSPATPLQTYLRVLAMAATRHDVEIAQISHVPGKENIFADPLSRNDLFHVFHKRCETLTVRPNRLQAADMDSLIREWNL